MISCHDAEDEVGDLASVHATRASMVASRPLAQAGIPDGRRRRAMRHFSNSGHGFEDLITISPGQESIDLAIGISEIGKPIDVVFGSARDKDAEQRWHHVQPLALVLTDPIRRDNRGRSCR